MKVRGLFQDLKTFKSITGNRTTRMQAAPAVPIRQDRLRDLTMALHPENLFLVIDSVTHNTATTRTFRLRPADDDFKLPPFRAGQYVSIKARQDGSPVTRPYSLSSSPHEAREHNYYEITIRKKDDGFFSPRAWTDWKPGDFVKASGPHGCFIHEPLRDTPQIVGLAGGSGITPFKSMIGEIAAGRLDADLTLIYGSRRPDDIVFFQELAALEKQAPERIHIIHVCSEPDADWQGATGFLDADCIRRHAGDIHDKTFFICGPQVMYTFLDKVMAELGVKPRRIRREVFGETGNIQARPDYPTATAGAFGITVHAGDSCRLIEAHADETVLVALEKAGIAHDSRCRSGECGFCRSQLISGEVFVNPENDGRREADQNFGYFHPCSSYPLSDLTIRIPVPEE